MKEKIAELDRIANEAVLEAVQARYEDPNCASDFGLRARLWENLAEAAHALACVLERDRGYRTVPPHEKAGHVSGGIASDVAG